MYTAFARNAVMGADPEWTHEVFGMALVPDLVLYLEIDVDTLVPRVVRGKGMDYWESGMHLALSSDIFDSFQNYQRRIIAEYNRLAHDFGFITIDARESINKIQTELRAHVSDYLRRAQAGLQPQADSPSPQVRKE
jgi:dTMP kinase